MVTTRIMRPKEVCRVIGVSRSTLERWRRSGVFPTPQKLGPQVVGWREATVDEWLLDRPPVDRPPA